jgi:hypothetical protein
MPAPKFDQIRKPLDQAANLVRERISVLFGAEMCDFVELDEWDGVLDHIIRANLAMKAIENRRCL